MVETLSIKSDSSLFDKVGEFRLSEKQIQIFTGSNWKNIIQIEEMLTSLRNTESRSVIQELVVFLFKLRTGNSNAFLASILQLENEHKVLEYSNSIIKSFEIDVLPFNFGSSYFNRNYLTEKCTTEMAKKLFNIYDQLFLIGDGTYAKHQKSTNNEYQRKSFSGQKKIPLCKSFTLCTTNGYIIDMFGPYLANQNDADTLRSVIEDPTVLYKFPKHGGIFVLDRGFRNVKDALEKKGFIVLMPALKGKRKQLSTEESNKLRFVTKVPWVVEAVHGVLKQKYRLLDHKIDKKLIPKTGSYLKIASFINNTFGERFESDVDISDEILDRMHRQKLVQNTLAIEVEENGWLRRKLPFTQVTSDDILDFPEMTKQDLNILFTGLYQLSQAVSYLAEMVDKDGKINIEYVKDGTNVLKVKVQSKHISCKTYRCFVRYKSNSVGASSVTRYTCECANGKRTVDCCSYVAAVIYYLSRARYLSRIFKPAEILSDIFMRTNHIPVIESDSDDD